MEMVCVTFLVVLMTGIVTTGVAMAIKQYEIAMLKSDANTLYSTLSTLITHDLENANKITLQNGNEVKDFQSSLFQLNVTQFKSDKHVPTQRKYYPFGTETPGYLVYAEYPYAAKKTTRYVQVLLMGEKAYSQGLLARVSKLTFDNSTNVFTVGLEIWDSNRMEVGDKAIVSGTFDVVRIYKD